MSERRVISVLNVSDDSSPKFVYILTDGSRQKLMPEGDDGLLRFFKDTKPFRAPLNVWLCGDPDLALYRFPTWEEYAQYKELASE
jgi:hypothetical protein